MKWFKKILLSIIWTLIFIILSAFIFNLLSGIIIGSLHSKTDFDIGENYDLINSISVLSLIVMPFFVGLLGLLLSILGKLPGTDIKKKNNS